MPRHVTRCQEEHKRKNKKDLINELNSLFVSHRITAPDRNNLFKMTRSALETFLFFVQRNIFFKKKFMRSKMYYRQDTIGDQLGYSRKTINIAVKDLHLCGFIKKYYRGIKKTCLYMVDFLKSYTRSFKNKISETKIKNHQKKRANWSMDIEEQCLYDAWPMYIHIYDTFLTPA